MSHRPLSFAAILAVLPTCASASSMLQAANPSAGIPIGAVASAVPGIVPDRSATGATGNATQAATLEALDRRLRRIEQLLGASATAKTATSDPRVADDNTITLDQRLRILERQHELDQEDAAARIASTPVISIGDKGLVARSPKGDVEFRLRGTVQADQRSFFGDKALPQNDTFLFRLVRPTIEGQLGPLVAFRITPEFAGDSATLRDAWVDLRFNPAYTLRVGKFTSPVGLERLQSSSTLELMERGFPSEIAPDRDIGAQLQGELAQGRVNYAVGAFNGAPDGRDAPATDADNHVEFAGRVFFEPWKNAANDLSGLGFGIAASAGDKQGTGNNFLPRYRTPGQNVFFQYRGNVAADGSHRRFSPQAYYYRDAFGILGEYIRSEQEVVLAGKPSSRITLGNSAWQLTGSWVVTGEDATYTGVLRPAHPFVANGEGWGALELVGRYGELAVDERAYPLYADPGSAARRARAWGLGLNWYLTSNLKLVLNHTQARFDGGAKAGGDREDEKTIFSRVQLSF